VDPLIGQVWQNTDDAATRGHVCLFMNMYSYAPMGSSPHHPQPRRAGIVGASGYTGAELLRLLDSHPEIRVEVITADSQAGSRLDEVHPWLAPLGERELVPTTPDAVDGLDVVFCGLPHEASIELVPQILDRVGHVVDLSAGFRFKDPAVYPRWYGFTHAHPELLDEAVYGLSEMNRDALVDARLIATPGCYVTAAVLGLAPLVSGGHVADTGIIVDAASGVTGAGRRAEISYAFTTVDEDLTAYGVAGHRHTPEIEMGVGGRVLFTPHLAPMNRGILATCYAQPLTDGARTTDGLLDALATRYAGERFIQVSDAMPHTKACLGSNLVQITARYDERTDTAIVISALDNLTKGASGGALQAANIALGLDESAGLSRIGVAP